MRYKTKVAAKNYSYGLQKLVTTLNLQLRQKFYSWIAKTITKTNKKLQLRNKEL